MNVYDFDKTIYKNDSTADFYLFCIRKKPTLVFSLFNTAAAALRYYAFKSGSKTDFKRRMYSFLRCVDAENLAEEFWDKNIYKIKKFYLERRRADDVIISASPEFLLRPACRRLGIENLIASEVDPKSGAYKGENCHGEEKVRRFYLRFPNGVIDNFYSDSHSDDPLAAVAGESFLVSGERLAPWKEG